MLSFPKPGISIALDMPMRGEQTQALVDALNEIVLAEGGRIYLAKDAFTRAEHFRAMEPRLPAWNAVRRKWDPEGRLKSAQSVRLLGRRAVKVALLGATRGMGRALARRMAERGDALFLLGRDRAELERSAEDLELRGAQRRRRHGGVRPARARPASRPRSTRADAALGGLRHRGRHRRAVRHAGRARGRPAPVRRPAHRRLHQHHPVLRGGARAPARARRRHACACSARWPASAAASR